MDRKCRGTQSLQMESLCKSKAERLQTGHQSRLPAAGIRVFTPPSIQLFMKTIRRGETGGIKGLDKLQGPLVSVNFYYFYQQ